MHFQQSKISAVVCVHAGMRLTSAIFETLECLAAARLDDHKAELYFYPE